MKVAYCGYDFFHGCMDAVLSRGHEIVELFTIAPDEPYDFNRKVSAKARECGARIQISPICPEDIDRLGKKGCDLILSAAYPYKIPPWEGHVSYGVNLHPTLLPEGRGRWPLPWIVLKELKESGVTLHKISPEWDRGDILLQKRFALGARESLETISMRCRLAAVDLVGAFLDDAEKLWSKARPQGEGSSWPFPADEDRTLDWSRDIETLDRITRAFGKFESFAEIDGRRIYVQDAVFWKESHAHKPGDIVWRANKETLIAAKDGFCCIRFTDGAE